MGSDETSAIARRIDEARRWLDEEPDPASAQALADLIARAEAGDSAACAEIDDAFAGALSFGTAGLRAALGPGPNRMNRTVVLRAAAGLAAYLQRTGGRAIVIGHDARHLSSTFARDTARVMAGAGITAFLLPRPLPTPVTAFAVRHLGADAGVMVTASHNPARDNGYKVYLGDGRQIAPPVDAEIAAAIDSVGAVADIPQREGYIVLDDTVVDAYVDRAVSLVEPEARDLTRVLNRDLARELNRELNRNLNRNLNRDLTVVYTPLHGVGAEVFLRCLDRTGFPEPVVVAEQRDPDPDFPTVAFPNPEEAGALDLAVARARGCGADLIVAHDPDADRVAIAMADGPGYRQLTGDEVGAILGWWTVERARRGLVDPVGALGTSLVSGTMLEAIAKDAGMPFALTLTGFKWISRVPGLAFGYEEALGYCVDPAAVADKDGITAALLLLDLARRLRADGRRLSDILDDLERLHGVHATTQVSLRVGSAAAARDVVAGILDDPPERIADRPILAIEDLRRGDSGLPPTDGVVLRVHDARIIVRPSGTEPKVKCYLEAVVGADRSRGDLAGARADAAGVLDVLAGALRRIIDVG